MRVSPSCESESEQSPSERVRHGGVASHRVATAAAAQGGALRPAPLGIGGLRNHPAAEMAGEATAVTEVATRDTRPSRAPEGQGALGGLHGEGEDETFCLWRGGKTRGL